MPKGLVNRFQKECIQEFRAAARQRYLDGFSLMDQNRRTAAIYLWGYAAEMVLKAAYFQAVNHAADDPIEKFHLKAAGQKAQSFGFTLGNYHDISAWANLLVNVRGSTPGLAYVLPGFSVDILTTVGALGQVWKETIRYHKNVAYRFEVSSALRATEWLMDHAFDL